MTRRIQPEDALLLLQPRPKRIAAEAGKCATPERVEFVRAPVPEAPGEVSGEAYALEIAPGGVTVRAPSAAGDRLALATLRQLSALAGGAPPCAAIADWPEYRWRGFMHDCGRNFLELESIRRILDLMAAYKFNLFHWHLTDYYGWRLESRLHPSLQSPRAFRRDAGKFYSQRDFADIVAYAADRGITVMPELDVPGHTLAFRRGLGLEAMADPRARGIVSDLIDELCSLAPPEAMPFVHLGTDEARNPPERIPPEWAAEWAGRVRANGRTPVGWTPGMDLGGAVQMLWNPGAAPSPGARAFDATRMYFGGSDCMNLLNIAAFSKPFRHPHRPGEALGPVACSWHDDALGGDSAALFRNNCVAPAIAMYSSIAWERRDGDRPEYLAKLPAPGTRDFEAAQGFERRIAAHRDVLFADSPLPFPFVRQTALRWRISRPDGSIVARDIAQGTIYVRKWDDGADDPNSRFVAERIGEVILETWIRSPHARAAGAWIGFTHFGRSGGRRRGVPDIGEWDAVSPRIRVEVNGCEIPPPRWGNAGLRLTATDPEEPTNDNVCETPFSNEEYWMREPARIDLRAGWNHVRILLPHSAERYAYNWSATFVPVEGDSAHPREPDGLEYSADPPDAP